MKNVGLLILLSLMPVAGYSFSTAELQVYCTSQAEEKVCHGYVSGVVDASLSASFCPQAPLWPARYDEFTAIAKKYIAAHPELGTYLAVDVVRKALREAYPCHK